MYYGFYVKMKVQAQKIALKVNMKGLFFKIRYMEYGINMSTNPALYFRLGSSSFNSLSPHILMHFCSYPGVCPLGLAVHDSTSSFS